MNELRSGIARRASAVVLAMLLTPALAIAQTSVKAGFNLFSPEQDVQVGQQSAAAAEQQLPIVNDSTVQSYVETIGQRLAVHAGGPQFQYRFRVVNSTDINAFALPGGFIYVNRGVLDQARNDGEVAGVLAHEISHVSLRHGTHQASKAYLAQAGIGILGGILGRGGEGSANIINAVGGAGLNVLFLKYGRDLETQADVRGAQIMAASGYSPSDMVTFFQTLEKVDKSRKTSFLADHPAPPDRIKRIQQEARVLNASVTTSSNTQQLAGVQDRLRSTGGAPNMPQASRTAPAVASGRPRGSAPANGAVVQVDEPSPTLRSYTAPSGVYRVSYPANWQVFQQGSTGVTFAPQGGVAGVAGNQAEIVYGAIVGHYDPFGNPPNAYGLRGNSSTANSNITMDDATSDLIAQLQQSSPHLRLVSNSRQRLKVDNGDTALAASLRGRNPNSGINERLTVVTRQLGDDHLLYLLFVTPDQDAARYQPVLQAMVNSLSVNENHHH